MGMYRRSRNSKPIVVKFDCDTVKTYIQNYNLDVINFKTNDQIFNYLNMDVSKIDLEPDYDGFPSDYNGEFLGKSISDIHNVNTLYDGKYLNVIGHRNATKTRIPAYDIWLIRIQTYLYYRQHLLVMEYLTKYNDHYSPENGRIFFEFEYNDLYLKDNQRKAICAKSVDATDAKIKMVLNSTKCLFLLDPYRLIGDFYNIDDFLKIGIEDTPPFPKLLNYEIIHSFVNKTHEDTIIYTKLLK